MSRFLNFVVMLAALMAILVVHTGTAPLMEDLRQHAVDEDKPNDDIDSTSIANELHTAVTKWVPTVAFIGLFVIAAFREYRRQRVTAVRRRRRRKR